MNRPVAVAMLLGAAILGAVQYVVVGVVPALHPPYVQLGLFCLMALAVITAGLVAKPLLSPPPKE